MQILETVAATRAAIASARRALGLNPRSQADPQSQEATLGLVPTMGALHAGHLALIARARAECAFVAASIFVNPLQFGPTEDFDRYPRLLAQDCALLADAGVDLVFAPTASEIYPDGSTTVVDPGPIGDRLDGASRPGHFRGVATVVTKLFTIVDPDRAYFGQKDAAQVAVLRHITRDLHLRPEIVACPTVRDPDGLALSSRNRFLSPAERAGALAIPRTLEALQSRIAGGTRDAAALLSEGRAMLSESLGLRLDYLEAVDPHTLLPVSAVTPGTLVAVAASVGATRLIDNILAG